MKWFILRVLVLFLSVSALSAAAVGVGRLDHTPTRLQTLGFDVCDGEPCFKGITAGMHLEAAKKLFPAMTANDGRFEFPLVGDDAQRFLISAGTGLYSVGGIAIERNPSAQETPLPFSAQDVVVQYGSPCHTYWEYGDNPVIVLVYPNMDVRILATQFLNGNTTIQRLELGSPALDLLIHDTTGTSWYGTCETPADEFAGQWYGFTSAEIYRHRNLASMRRPYPAPGDGS
jgi:hypothetical protein